MRVVGLSGAQGGGKTSLLNELQARGYQVDQFKVSRAVQAQLGWKSLDHVMDSFETMKQFQDEVFNQKYKNDFSIKAENRAGIVLVERTFADIAAYTSLWAWKFIDAGVVDLEEAMRWLVKYVGECAIAQNRCYEGTILLPLMDHIVFEDDPHRAKREDASYVFEEIEQFMHIQLPCDHDRIILSEKTIHDRADEVEQFLRAL